MPADRNTPAAAAVSSLSGGFAGKVAVLVLREQALPLAEQLATVLNCDVVRGGQEGERASALFRQQFRQYQGWVVLGSAGIVVRFLDGQLQDKHSDPAVVVLDEGGHHAIALLSGHEGGANDLAYAVANAVGAAPVITTATEALKPLIIGVGCRKGVGAAAIEKAVRQALGERSIADVRCVATIDIKASEPGLVEFCQEHKLPLRVLKRQDLTSRNWVTEPSEWVQENVGLAGVCEPCALTATTRGQLIVPKIACDGVAVAVVEDRWEP